MIALLLALQDTLVEALPEDVASAAAEATAAAAHSSINYFDLMLKASLPVKLIILLLLAGSVISWVIIFRKSRVFSRANREADDFEGRFWSGAELHKLYAGATDRNRVVSGLEAIFEAGFREFTKLRSQKNLDPKDVIDGSRRAMRATYQREVDSIDAHLAFLASVGSVSPYVGLFGTVWGIMHSFRGLSNVGQATLSAVAPGIAEALVATAIGLFAAIPAVVAYNRFSHEIDRLATRFESFMEEFSNILQRQMR